MLTKLVIYREKLADGTITSHLLTLEQAEEVAEIGMRDGVIPDLDKYSKRFTDQELLPLRLDKKNTRSAFISGRTDPKLFWELVREGFRTAREVEEYYGDSEEKIIS